MLKKRKKLYADIPDSKMLTEAQTFHTLFVENLDDFEASDETLNEDFALAMQAKIDAAIRHPTDDNVNDEIAQLATHKKKAWKDCGKHFQDAKYFIEKAFPGNATLHNTFGYSDYKSMTRSQKKVIRFMDLFGDAVSEHQTALRAVGYKQQAIDAIPTLTTNFENAMLALTSAKKARPVATQTRTILMNDVWSCIQTINGASKIIYRTDYARLRQFYMPAPPAKAAKGNEQLTAENDSAAAEASSPIA